MVAREQKQAHPSMQGVPLALLCQDGRDVTVTVLYLHNMWLKSGTIIPHAISNLIKYVTRAVSSGALVWGHQFLCSWSSMLDYHTTLWRGLYFIFMSSQWHHNSRFVDILARTIISIISIVVKTTRVRALTHSRGRVVSEHWVWQWLL